MQILMVRSQLDKVTRTVGVVWLEWATEQLKPSQKLDFHTRILGNWKIIWQCWSWESVASPCRPWGRGFWAQRNLAFWVKHSSAGRRSWWVTDSGFSWLLQISKTFPVLDDDHMAAVLFAKALAGGKKGFYRYNQNIAGIIISVSVPGTDMLQKTVVRVKLLCGVGECSSASMWVFASARKQLWTLSWASSRFAH